MTTLIKLSVTAANVKSALNAFDNGIKKVNQLNKDIRANNVLFAEKLNDENLSSDDEKQLYSELVTFIKRNLQIVVDRAYTEEGRAHYQYAPYDSVRKAHCEIEGFKISINVSKQDNHPVSVSLHREIAASDNAASDDEANEAEQQKVADSDKTMSVDEFFIQEFNQAMKKASDHYLEVVKDATEESAQQWIAEKMKAETESQWLKAGYALKNGVMEK